ncbi:MAG: hypothetical protein HY753_03380 [Nitrospirae bacterium]|nr:hypothetical protein [Nitrospirota bacterium]
MIKKIFHRESNYKFSIKIACILFVVLYTISLLIYPRLGPSDEYQFLPTLQSGKSFPIYGADFPYYDVTALGRFTPLAIQEYNLVASISNTPLAYLAFNAILLLGFIIIFLKILREFSSSNSLNYFAVVLLLFMPAVTNTFFKFLYVEKNVIFYLSVFLISFIKFHKQQRIVYSVLALVSANIAIYYKEIVFLAIFAFSAAHLFLTWRQNNKKYKVLDLLLMLSSIIYIAIYFAAILPNVSHSYLPSTPQNKFLSFVKNSFNYGFFSDPIIVLIFVPIAFWRIAKIIFQRQEPHPVIDAMIAAGSSYVAAFFLLNMYSPYYMLPVYLFALPAIFYFFEQGVFQKVFWKSMLAVAILVLAVNTIPLGIHYITYNKYVPVNFNKTLDFLIADINRRYEGHRLNIFFDGVDRGGGSGVYFITGEFLKFKGLSIRRFDFKSDIEARETGPFVGRRSPFDKDADIEAVDPEHTYKYPDFPFEVFQPGPLPQVQSGDYLIVSPHSTKNVNNEYIEKLKDDYTLIFRTYSPLAFPRITLKTGLKYLLSKKEYKWGIRGNKRKLFISPSPNPSHQGRGIYPLEMRKIQK